MTKEKIRFEIQTTEELKEAVYFTNDLEIQGSFLKFKPYKMIVKEQSHKQENIEIILPERCIKEIVRREINK